MASCLRKIFIMFLAFILVVGCAGRTAAPVNVYQYGDEKKSCKALQSELAFTESEIQRLLPQTEKTGKNVALGIAGAFLLVPWFFMDMSKAEQIEINALRQRYNHLVIISNEKDCGFDIKEIPDFKESAKKSEQK